MLNKINSYLGKFFLIALVITQAILFVSVKAQLNNDLVVKFVNPTAGQEITIGDSIIIQAYVGNIVSDLDTVHFVLQSAIDDSVEIYWQADSDSANLWTADSAWDTSNYIAGVYNLSVKATAYDNEGKVENFSSVGQQQIILIPAAKTNSSKGNDNNLDLSSLPNVTSTASITAPAEESVISSGEHKVVVNEITPQPSPEPNESVEPQKLNPEEKPLVESAKPVESDEPVIEDFTPEPITPEQYEVNLLQPSTVVTSENFVVSFATNFSADTLIFGIINREDVAISLADKTIQRVDNGQVWSQIVTLPVDIFINGEYEISALAYDSSGGQYPEVPTKFYFTLDLPRNNNQSVTLESSVEPDDDSTLLLLEDKDKSEDNQLELLVDNSSELPLEPATPKPTIKLETKSNYLEDNDEPTKTNYLCQENNITDPQTCEQWLVLVSEDIDAECLGEDIYDPQACEDYLNRVYVDRECQKQNIIDAQACEDYLMEKYAAEVNCQLAEQSLCEEILRGNYLNRLVVRQQQQDKIGEVVEPLIGQVITTGDLDQRLANQSVVEVLPIQAQEDVRVLIINSSAAVTLLAEQNLEVIGGTVLILDNDGDGLPNDLENYYQTDLNNPDTDNDGFVDGQEISNGYNPLGSGKLAKTRTNLDKVILNGQSLEQPKATNNTDYDFVVARAISQTEAVGVTLQGKADPNTWVTIYLYSDLPLVMLAKTDDVGNWSYIVQNSLVDGEHQVYVTTNDDKGKIIKQSPGLSFFVRNAQAVSVAEYFSATPEVGQVNNLILYYILGATLLVLVILGILVYFHRNKGEEGTEDIASPANQI